MVIVFDLNGTLVDTSAIAPALRRIFGQEITAEHFMAEVLKQWMATTLSHDFRPFDDLAVSVLQMLAAAHSVSVTPAQVEQVRTAMLHLLGAVALGFAAAALIPAGYFARRGSQVA